MSQLLSDQETVVEEAPKLTTADVQMAARDSCNGRFLSFAENRTITVVKRPIFTTSDVLFTMGSCFAEEIRRALTRMGMTCVPALKKIEFDRSSVFIDGLPAREHLNYYNSYTIRQQLELALGKRQQDESDYWTVMRRPADVPWTTTPTYQDPYRRLFFSTTVEGLHKAQRDLDEAILAGIRDATGFIFTFGMTEVFRNKVNGNVVAQKPNYGGGGGRGETTVHLSTFEENIDNVRAIIALVREARPDAPIIMSVSPVPLSRTFSGNDVTVMNMESKSILRAVLGQVSREFDNVFYLPSYELVTFRGLDNGFIHDLRHVQPKVVEHIMQTFFDTFLPGDGATPQAADKS